MTEVDWAAWSREARALMQRRNTEWRSKWQLGDGAAYRWSLEPAELVFPRSDDEVVADITVVGTCSQSEHSFLWGWANDSMPEASVRALSPVRAFGEEHDLGLLREAEWPAGHSESLEALVLAGRLLDAEGVFVDPMDDVTIYFAFHSFRSREPRK